MKASAASNPVKLQAAKLTPAKGRSLSEIQDAIAEIKAKRITLSPPGKPKLSLKDIVNEGHP